MSMSVKTTTDPKLRDLRVDILVREKPRRPVWIRLLPKMKWRWIVFYVILSVIGASLINSAASRIFGFWDVGSNSWWAKFNPDPWQYQRGAATVAQDEFGDQFTTVRYLRQGWTPAQSMWFYNTTQGSNLLPYDFFMALETKGSKEPFRSNEHMNHYRYLVQKPTWSNPDGLPVGFVKNRYDRKDYLGFTCAACHTSQLNYQGTGIRIDGAPSGADMDTFLHDLAGALTDTLESTPAPTDSIAAQDENNSTENEGDIVRKETILRAKGDCLSENCKRFVRRVMDRGNYDSEKDVIDDLKTYSQQLRMYNFINRSHTHYGYSRLDAFGRIYNRVLENVLTASQLKEVLDDMASRGELTKKEADSILEMETKNTVLTGNDRDHIVERVAKLLPLRVQLELSKQIFNEPNAPVSYPFLWDIPQHDYVQWNGVVANAGIGPIGRNAGEAIGVFATLDFAEVPQFSLSATIASVLSGQGLSGRHVSYRSSINVHNLRHIEKQLWSLKSPKWPDEILPRIDMSARARGQALFDQHCASCHAEIQSDNPQRRVVAHMTGLKDIGTDSKMADNSVDYKGYSGIMRNQYASAGPGQILIDKEAPVAAIVTKTTSAVVATPAGDKNFIRRFLDWADDLLGTYFSNPIKPSLKAGNYTPDTTAEPYASLRSYKARSLNGIWATAPYLHNGSVPTLYDLLLPQKKMPGDPEGLEYRPDKFRVGSREFDPKKAGFKSEGYTGFLFDTSRRGNSNAGHEYGTRQLNQQQRLDLVEYLKSL